MSVRDSILTTINALLRQRGMELRAVPPVSARGDMDGALWRASRRGIEVGTAIDVGAAAGSWTQRALAAFPAAKLLLIEPLAERTAELTALRAAHPQVDFVTAAAGAQKGEVAFSVAPDLDNSGVYQGFADRQRMVPMTTLDDEVQQRRLPGPYLIKLDTHGFEIPILQGASRCLTEASLLFIEAYNFPLTEGALLFHELCAWLDQRGFRPIDLVDVMRRPGDHALWQMDLVFARKDSAVSQRSSYK